MCSIAGSSSKQEAERMIDLMKHRAPDDSGVIFDGKFAIGMGRLAILDLTSNGLCPYQEDNLVLTFNGEVYNYVELREELKKLGHVFHTTSDTEVLLKAYKEWGEGCLQRLNGMFAFAIYDGTDIFLARDISGEKPLYYTNEPFRFASEAKSLHFQCNELPPAYWGRYTIATGEFISKRYWHKPTSSYGGTYEDALRELDRLLEDSVKIRTRADVPYGLYFSGGIDSTLISSYHKFHHRYTYTDGDYKEEFLEVFPRILYHLDGPVETFSPFGLWKLAEEASKEVKVVLSGEGADELFGGYVRYVPNEFNRVAQTVFPSYKSLFPYKDMLGEEFDGNMRELLRMGDRMASAWGIENRCPFLDRRIIEFAMSLPSEWKIQGFETKKILKDLIKRRLPDYKFEEKKGLFCSVNTWLGHPEEGFDKGVYRKYQRELWQNISKSR